MIPTPVQNSFHRRAPEVDSNFEVISLGHGPTVAVAHGAGGGVEPNFAELAEGLGRTLVGPNYPGSGRSQPATEPLQLEPLADQVVAAGLATGAQSFPVLGLSLGTAVAVTAAVRHPDRVSALVLTVGLPRADVQAEAFARTWHELALNQSMETLSWHILSGASPAEALAALDPATAKQVAAQIAANYPVGGADQVDLVRRLDITALLPEVTVPTLVVVGGQDRIVLPSSTRALAEGIAGAELVEYAGAGHIFDPAHTDQWRRDIDRFFTKHSR